MTFLISAGVQNSMTGASAALVLFMLILAILVILVLALVCMYLQAQRRQLQIEHTQNRSQHEKLQLEYRDSQFQYVEVQTRLNDLAREQFTAWRDKELEALQQRLWEAAWNETMTKAKAWLADNQKRIREEAIRQSTSVVTGKVTEHLTPYIGRFRYNPKDVRFLGAPIDLIVFDGLSEGTLRQIVFLEIKTGTGSLNKRERQVRDMVREKQVVWDEFHIPTADGSLLPQ